MIFSLYKERFHSLGFLISVINDVFFKNKRIFSERALKYAESIISGKQISRPYLGITIYDATNYYSNTSGIYIEYVEQNSAADKAGLQKGDKILEVNGKEVSNSSYFKHELYKYDVGEQITIKVERNGKEKEIKITLGSNNIVS